MINKFEVFTTQIAKIYKSIRRLKTIKSSKFNLKGPYVYCIYYLYKHTEGLTARELSTICDEDKGGISRALEFLEENGYIYCSSTAKKRYNSTLYLTDKGKNIGNEFVKIIDNIITIVGEGTTEEERKIFYKVLLSFSDNLQKISEDIGEDYD